MNRIYYNNTTRFDEKVNGEEDIDLSKKQMNQLLERIFSNISSKNFCFDTKILSYLKLKKSNSSKTLSFNNKKFKDKRLIQDISMSNDSDFASNIPEYDEIKISKGSDCKEIKGNKRVNLNTNIKTDENNKISEYKDYDYLNFFKNTKFTENFNTNNVTGMIIKKSVCDFF